MKATFLPLKEEVSGDSWKKQKANSPDPYLMLFLRSFCFLALLGVFWVKNFHRQCRRATDSCPPSTRQGQPHNSTWCQTHPGNMQHHCSCSTEHDKTGFVKAACKGKFWGCNALPQSEFTPTSAVTASCPWGQTWLWRALTQHTDPHTAPPDLTATVASHTAKAGSTVIAAGTACTYPKISAGD